MILIWWSLSRTAFSWWEFKDWTFVVCSCFKQRHKCNYTLTLLINFFIQNSVLVIFWFCCSKRSVSWTYSNWSRISLCLRSLILSWSVISTPLSCSQTPSTYLSSFSSLFIIHCYQRRASLRWITILLMNKSRIFDESAVVFTNLLN